MHPRISDAKKGYKPSSTGSKVRWISDAAHVKTVIFLNNAKSLPLHCQKKEDDKRKKTCTYLFKHAEAFTFVQTR